MNTQPETTAFGDPIGRNRSRDMLFGWMVGLAWLVGMLTCVGAGPLTRVPNTTLALPETPGSFGYTMAPMFPGLTFVNPVAILSPPGETNRLFVVERTGRIAVITNLAQPTRTVFLNISSRVRLDNFNEMGLLGMAFHPKYAENGRFFLFYTTTATTTGSPNARHDRLSEFRVDTSNPNLGNATSESILLQQADDMVNHNGGDLQFGPDGYLYVALGDEGGANDAGRNAQKINADFFAGILRLDVDNRPGSLAPNPHPAVVGGYRIPVDNPYVGASSFNGRAVNPGSVRTEFWSVGLRNPWRMSFDPLTGELWVGEVGQDQREGVVIARRGSNHGWAYRELDVAGPDAASAPVGFRTNPVFNYVAPVWSYAHGSGTNRGNSVIGGVVYRGNRLSDLYGAYVFSDYVSGNIWSLRRTTGVPLVTRLTGAAGLSAFGVDPRNGDILATDHGNNRILRLQYNATFTGAPLPDRLSGTGAFQDLTTMAPHPGIIPYEINTPFWSDAATKFRWFSIPKLDSQFGFEPLGNWKTPSGTVWIKQFEIERIPGVPDSKRRLETRFLVRNAGGIYGVTYRWNDEQTDAVLVPEMGLDEVIERQVGGSAVQQVWRYPSRAECRACHNPTAGFALGFNTAQLHREFQFPSGSNNYIEALALAGYFSNRVDSLRVLPRSAGLGETNASVAWRARSWLSVNCSPCHQPGGLGSGQFDTRLSTPTSSAGLILGPLQSPSGDIADRVVVPGDLVHSKLFTRINTRGLQQMPPLATSIVDEEGVEVIRQWIQLLSIPTPNTQVDLQIATVLEGLRIEAIQPAERAIQLQVTGTPTDPASWTTADLSGNEFYAPIASRVIRWTLPVGTTDGVRFYRALVIEP